MSIKRILPGLILVLLLTVPAMAETRIGTIDLRKVFDNYWKRQEAEASLKVRGGRMIVWRGARRWISGAPPS